MVASGDQSIGHFMAAGVLQCLRIRTHSLLELYLPRLIHHAVPAVAISQIQSDGQYLLRNIPALLCPYGTNLLHCRSPLSLVPQSTPTTWQRTPHPAQTGHLISSVLVNNPERRIGGSVYPGFRRGDLQSCSILSRTADRLRIRFAFHHLVPLEE